ncbi:hypothetical protein [Labilibaculum euxinus]|uniref:Uncharacterized protein n=1 Tax=Labilibaculum euxinus TaxID=2686357 RepID=A0A7M4DAE4_9BACT|nr:hypothetical protein [Labilibaculum euxinus]MUP39623.1 hypothetical protein [Labilibaculum euxinus]MVB08828.1 hypothetical protein [Labilibaculum euxinus]
MDKTKVFLYFLFFIPATKIDEKNYYLCKEEIKTGSKSKIFSEILDPKNPPKVFINGSFN